MLTEKIALVTGASRGIGKAIAANLVQQGACVIGTATTESGAKSISSHLQSIANSAKNPESPKPYGEVLNLLEPDSITAAVEKIGQTVGKPDILVNNAGLTADNLFLRMQTEQWDKVITANLTGVFQLTKACIRPMVKARWGRIINLSSIVAFTGNLGQANYSAAKAAVVAMSKSLALEIASRGITVNVVAPGFIDTDMTKDLQPEQHAKLLDNIPMGRMGTPADVAGTVSFLVSNAAAYITGETIQVNGGMLMR